MIASLQIVILIGKSILQVLPMTIIRMFKFIGNIFHIDSDTDIDDNGEDRFMVTAEVKW